MSDACQGLFPTKFPSVESTDAAPLPQIVVTWPQAAHGQIVLEAVRRFGKEWREKEQSMFL